MILNHLNEAKKILEPYCPALTVKERGSIPKMSNANFAFGAKALAHAVNHPEFLPPYISLNDWKIDMADVTASMTIGSVLSDLDQMNTDLRMLSGSEAYHAGRALYHNVQRAAADGVAGAQPVYDDLSPNFTNRRHKPKARTQE